MKRLIVFISLLLCLSSVSSITPFYILKGGSIIRDDNSDCNQVKAIEWQVRLYKKGTPKIGSSYWGVIKGRTADEVMTKLKSRQEFELKFNAFIGKGYIKDKVFTNFNSLGPIAIIDESKLEESSNKSNYDRLSEVIGKAKDYYDVYMDVENNIDKIINTKPTGPFDNYGNVFKEYTDNLKDVLKNIDKLKNALINDTENKLGQIKRELSIIDNGYQTLNKIHANFKKICCLNPD